MYNIILYSPHEGVAETKDLEILKDSLKKGNRKIWVDIEDADDDEIDLLLNLFNFHPLAIENALLGVEIPKIDLYGDYGLLAMHRLFYNFETESCERREFEIFFSENYIVTLHDKNLARTFASVKQKVLHNPKDTLGVSPSFVLFHLLALAIKDYEPVMEEWQGTLDEIEQQMLRGDHDKEILNQILKFKKLVATMRKSLLPEREAIKQLNEEPAISLIHPKVQPYLKSTIGEMQALLHELENLREHASSVFDVYAAILTIRMTESSHQLNFVMQRLTIAATIFMPLTFIVGVYGMNFDYMPEFHWKGFYYILWGFMAALAGGMLWFFKRKKWL